MGPQHPSTHGVLRLILEIDGETVTETRAGIGYLHTGIEKNMEFRTWTQGVTFCTRMDYLTPLFNEAVYCLGVEKLLGITDEIPERASVIRVLMMELNRITSPPGLPGHRRHGDGRHHGHDRRLPRARADPGDLRDDHRPAHEPRVHPPRRRRPGPAAGRHRQGPRHDPAGAPRPARARAPAQREPHPQGPHRRRRLPRPDRAAWRWASPARCCARPACRTTCASPTPTAATRPTTSRSSPAPRPTPTPACAPHRGDATSR